MTLNQSARSRSPLVSEVRVAVLEVNCHSVPLGAEDESMREVVVEVHLALLLVHRLNDLLLNCALAYWHGVLAWRIGVPTPSFHGRIGAIGVMVASALKSQ